MRMRSKWYKKEKQRTAKEIAGALAFIYWQCAVDRIKHMRAASFSLFTPEVTLATMRELLILLLHLTDRQLHETVDDNQRAEIIQLLAINLSNTYDENATDALGFANHKSEFINLSNERIGEYAEISASGEALQFSLSRVLAQNITQQCQENDKPWISSQLIEIEIPALFEKYDKATSDLLI